MSNHLPTPEDPRVSALTAEISALKERVSSLSKLEATFSKIEATFNTDIAVLKERLSSFSKVEAKIDKLTTFATIAGALVLVLGISGGVLMSKFNEAQNQINTLAEKVGNSTKIVQDAVDVSVESGKSKIDTYIAQHPYLNEFSKVADNFNKLITSNPGTLPKSPISAHPGLWGEWTNAVMAPPGHYVVGIRVRFEPHQGEKDDSALNAVELITVPFKR